MSEPGRNAPCPCGSGKKYKHCCLTSRAPLPSAAPASTADPTEETLRAGIRAHEQGDLPRAEALYRQVLDIHPNHAEALHLLGVAAYQTGNYPSAAEMITAAIERDGSVARYHNNLGTVLSSQQQLAAAVACYREAVRLDPRYAEAHYNLATTLQHQGLRDEAIDSFREALRLEPTHAEAHNNLGNALHAGGRLDEAAAHYRAALRSRPDYAEAHNNLGAVFREQNRIDDAVAEYREALRLDPHHAQAHNNLGAALHAQGRQDEAAAHYQAALHSCPDFAEAHNNLGSLLYERGDFAASGDHLREAVRLNPEYAEAHNNLGNALHAEGRGDEAVFHYREALRLCPSDAEAHNNLGTILWDQGHLTEAIDAYREALRADPHHAQAHNNLGVALQGQRLHAEAAAHYQAALLARPEFAEAQNNLGGLFCEQNDFPAAAACLREAVRLNPDYAEAHFNLGYALTGLDDPMSAITHFREAVRLRPDHADALDGLIAQTQRMCAWDGLADLWESVRNLIRTHPAAPFSPFVFMIFPTSPDEQHICAANWATTRVAPITRIHPAFAHSPGHRSKLRLGYLSYDFRSHPVAYLAAELFDLHDRERFEVFAYSIGPDDGSPIRRRIAGAVDRFVDVAPTSIADAARIIHDDRVDILVDLTGYTRGARPQILALRPAPIQVSYLGYPGTMGADFVDVIVTDDFVTPPDQQRHFSERFAYLPRVYQINDRRRPIATVAPTRSECGLPEDGFVYCCFNGPYKITPEVFDVWMRLLARTRGSVLWLLSSHPIVVDNLRREAAARGIDPGRLVFAPPLPLPDHLARHRLADLFLDTLPVNAHTTASDALWAGLPVLTCVGETFIARVAGSLLRAVGLPELVTTCLDDYETLALHLAHAPEELSALRARLAAGRLSCPLFDSPSQTRALEQIYETLWSNYLVTERAA